VGMRRGRWKTVCARGANLAPSRGRSASPLDVVTGRAAIGFLVAPLAAIAVLFLNDLIGGRQAGFPVVTIVGFGVIAYLVAAFLTAALGIPIFLVLRHVNLVRWWSALLSGAAIGVLVALAFGAVHDGVAIIVMSAAGAASAFVFWLIVAPVTTRNNRWRGP